MFSLREKARMQTQYRGERKLNMEENPQEERTIRALGPVRLVDRLVDVAATTDGVIKAGTQALLDLQISVAIPKNHYGIHVTSRRVQGNRMSSED